MDLHALLAPLIRPLVSSSSPSGGGVPNHPSASSAALDRTLGAAATFGLSIAIYRLVSAALRERREGGGGEGGRGAEEEGAAGGKAAGILALPAFLLSFLRIVLQGAIVRRIEDGGVGDAYHRAAYGAASPLGAAAGGRSGGDGPEVQHRGSCHCGSIRFTLKAPARIRAVDCEGKIRYPHYRTTADNFQLTKGSKHLKMYYVTVPSSDDNRGHGAGGGGGGGGGAGVQNVMAAHTFCSRCGVNILRAPDSDSDALEVNVGLFDDSDGSTVGVTFYDGRSGLGAGVPLQDQWTAGGDENATQLDEATCSPLHLDDISTFWPAEPDPSPAAPVALNTPPASYNAHPNGGKAASSGGMPDTPSTSATTMSDSLPLPSRVVVSHPMSSSEDLESSVDSAEDLTVSIGGGLSVIGEGVSGARGGSGGGESSWAVGTSLRPSPREGLLPPLPTTVNRDQLKYYMRRHLNTPSPSSSSVSDGK